MRGEPPGPVSQCCLPGGRQHAGGRARAYNRHPEASVSLKFLATTVVISLLTIVGYDHFKSTRAGS